ncbi:hypothetical protein J4731_16290 [Providencia rettgeri]|nr:hypothetical protein [Providencia rettgeri]
MNISTANVVNTNGSIKTNSGNIAIRATGKIDNNYTLRSNVVNADERGIRAGGNGSLTIETTT